MNNKKIFYCKNCFNMSTRPRITFDDKGWCNACQWMEEKKILDWKPRKKELLSLLDKHRSNESNFDCIVPVSGGKDGSYVAYMLKHKYNMNPLAVTVRPSLALDVGDNNLKNFINSGYSHIHISCNHIALDKLNKYGFIEKGFPYYGWLIAVMTAVIKTAVNFKIPLIFYGEDGEMEYGGSSESKNKAIFDMEYMRKIYLEGGHDKILNKIEEDDNINQADMSLFKFPKEQDAIKSNLSFTHWSYFEPWDSYRNYVVAKEHCGLMEKESGNHDTFTNFAQNDQALVPLHQYMKYIKFGFGRTTQDVDIDIRRGSMSREQGLNLIKLYDNAYPYDLIDTYLEYYKMTKKEFDDVLDKYANKDLFEKIDGIWQPKFEVGVDFYI